MLLAYSAYSSALKLGATFSSETSVNFYQTTLHHILEDSTLHIQQHENLNYHKPYKAHDDDDDDDS
jgi:hypothetical protein